MTREEAINEINKVFTSAYANYIVTALTEGATVSDIQRRWGRAYEAGVKDGLEQEPCEDAVSRDDVVRIVQHNNPPKALEKIRKLTSVTPQEPRWIPVTERLPEENRMFLVTLVDKEDGRVCLEVVWYSHVSGEWEEVPTGEKVIAWMPLPKPYKAESEG